MAAETEQTRKKTRRRLGVFGRLWLGVRICVGLVVSLSLVGALALYLGLWIGGQVLILPDGVTTEVTRRLNGFMSRGEILIGEIGVEVGDDRWPRLVVFNLDLRDGAGGAAGAVRRLTVDLAPTAILRGQPGVSGINFAGAQMTVRRAENGAFSVDFGESEGGSTASLPEALDGLDRSLDRPALASIESISVEDLTVVLEDARTGRVWQAANARSVVRKSDGELSMTLATDVFNGTDTLGEVQISAEFDRATRDTALAVRVRDVAAGDVALQSGALSWLSVVDAPLSGAVRATFDGEGTLESLAGTLDMHGGALQPTPASTPVPFQSAAIYFDVDPSAQRINFSNIEVASQTLTLSASGTTDLTEFDGPWPGAFVGQMRIDQASYAPEGMFEEPFSLKKGQADFRLRLDPFTLDFGQIWVEAEDARADARGQVLADEDGWAVRLDARSEEVPARRVLSSWPVFIAPGTRAWLTRNVQEGLLRDVAAALRFEAGKKPDIGFSFDYENATLTYLADLPPIENAYGSANMAQHRLTVRVDEGQVVGPSGNALDASGTVFSIPNLRIKPSLAELDLVGSGPLGTALTLLDRRPFRVLSRVGRTPDIADGLAAARATVTFPLKKGIQPSEVDYDVTARVFDVGSDQIAEGRQLTAEVLDLTVTPNELVIEGPAELDGLPVAGTWRQPIGQGVTPGDVTGTARVTPQRLAELGVRLPDGMFRGETTADWTLSFTKDEAPRLSVVSDLRGAVLDLGSVGWRKGANTPGGLDLVVDLADPPVVRQLALSAPGLAAEGTVALNDAGQFRAANFQRVRLGGFLDAPVTITPGARNVTNIEIGGGTFDLRNFKPGEGGGGSGSANVTFALDRAVISDGLSVASASGGFTTDGGVEGSFTGSLNGASPIEGDLLPFRGRTAVQMTAADAGQTIRAAKLMKNTYGGDLTLNLIPRGASDYDGEFVINGITIRQAPVMAELLDAISIVGLFDALNGPGLFFDKVDGRFLLTEDQLVLNETAAVGGSLGLSLDGTYALDEKQLDMAGVISPVYFLNSIGQIFTRRGEGLFGFSFRLNGAADDPRVSVNPLSILTPGMFREIFRRAPPGQ